VEGILSLGIFEIPMTTKNGIILVEKQNNYDLDKNYQNKAGSEG
jgi:hypothetical protein